jgi:hypothetical protein
MRKFYVVLGLAAVMVFVISLSGSAYDKPFKMGKGRYLTADEIKALKEDIAKNGSPEFTKAYDEAYKEQSALGDKAGIRFIRFTEVEKVFGPPPRDRKDKPLYLVLFAGTEGAPKKDLEKRKNAKGDYDIWVIGGAQYLKFDKDLKANRYTFLGSGAAE